MEILQGLEKIDVKDLFVGEIYNPQIFLVDKNGKKNGETKAYSMNKFDVATKNADGDFVSVVDGSVYSDGSIEKVVSGKADNKKFFWNVESFAKVTGKKGKISKRAAAKEAKAINAERNQSLGL